MTKMTDEELDKLAELLVVKVHQTKHGFWIDGEKHYNEHKKLEPLSDEHIYALIKFAEAFQKAEGSVMKTFLFGVAVCGIFVGAATWASIAKIWP